MKISRKLFQFFVFYLKVAVAIADPLNNTNEEKCENKVEQIFSPKTRSLHKYNYNFIIFSKL
jgi:hypothetical protein